MSRIIRKEMAKPLSTESDQFRFLIDKTSNQPRAGNPIDFWAFAGDPFHGYSLKF